jgi:hypothetical protein
MKKPNLYLHALAFFLLGCMTLFASNDNAHQNPMGENGEHTNLAPSQTGSAIREHNESKITSNKNATNGENHQKVNEAKVQNGTKTNVPGEPESTGPETVTIGIYLFNIRDINSGRGTFTSDFCVWSQSQDIDNIIGELQFANADRIVWSVEGKPEVNGLACVKRSGTGVFRMNWDFKNYPYDRQKLRILINYTLKDASKVILAPDEESSGISMENIPNGWELKGFNMEPVQLVYDSNLGDPNLGSAHGEFSGIETSIDIERKDPSEYWMITLVAYATAFIFIISFFLESSNTSRLGLLGASFIACVFSLRTSLSAMGVFGTSVDRLHLIVMGYITFAVICTAMMNFLVHHHNIAVKSMRHYSMILGVLTALSFFIVVWYIHPVRTP